MSGEREHDIDPTDIDDLDEISGDEQQALVWCNTHERYEWHWIERTNIPNRRRRT